MGNREYGGPLSPAIGGSRQDSGADGGAVAGGNRGVALDGLRRVLQEHPVEQELDALLERSAAMPNSQMPASEIKQALRESLQQVCDKRFAERGFRRTEKGTLYVRRTMHAAQSFDFTLSIRPTYAKDAIAHLYPRVHLEMPALTEMALELVDGQRVLLANAPEILLNRPFEHFVPLDQREQWYIHDVGDFDVATGRVTQQFVQWGLPFFDDYTSPDGVIHGYECSDLRPQMQQSWFLFVVAAYILKNEYHKALDVAEREYGAKKGVRRKYSVLFDWLGRHSEGGA